MLTPAQLATIKTAIQANPTWNALPNTNVGNSQIANDLNATAVPDFIVWRTSVSLDEIVTNGFTWTEVDNLTVGKARIWEWLFRNNAVAINPSQDNVRAGIVECWSGTAPRIAVQTAVLNKCKRKANGIEKILSTGTGSDASPAKMGFEGTITPDEIEQARSL